MSNPATPFLHVWLLGYVSPRRLVETLAPGPAPQWGFTALTIRGAMVSLLLYLPLALMGRIPPTPSYLTFLPDSRYYLALVGLSPMVFFAQWLIGGSVVHVVLRLCGRESCFDGILNITGMATLVVGTLLIIWDWIWVAVGGIDQIWLGISHLIIDGWGVSIAVTGFKRILGVPLRMAVPLALTSTLVGLPLAIMVMRSPL